jgi:DMSO/TMAO reductase YedYZ molybdopterin-dependent catalytic subunit
LGIAAEERRFYGQSASRALIIREREPVNLESPFSSLETFITPNELFYIRNHFAMPQVDVAAYRLRVGGAVERPIEISYDELRSMPSTIRYCDIGVRWKQSGVLSPANAGRSVGTGSREQRGLDGSASR